MRTWLTGLIGALVVGVLSVPADAQINVWGDLQLRGYVVGGRVAPNGHTYFVTRADYLGPSRRGMMIQRRIQPADPRTLRTETACRVPTPGRRR